MTSGAARSPKSFGSRPARAASKAAAFWKGFGRLDADSLDVGAIPVEDLLRAELVGGACRLKKHCVRDDHRQLRIKQVVEALRRCEGDQRRRIGDDDFDINRHRATAV